MAPKPMWVMAPAGKPVHLTDKIGKQDYTAMSISEEMADKGIPVSVPNDDFFNGKIAEKVIQLYPDQDKAPDVALAYWKRRNAEIAAEAAARNADSKAVAKAVKEAQAAMEKVVREKLHYAEKMAQADSKPVAKGKPKKGKSPVDKLKEDPTQGVDDMGDISAETREEAVESADNTEETK